MRLITLKKFMIFGLISTSALASPKIQDDIKSIELSLKSKQIFTLKKKSDGNFNELAYTRIEKPTLSARINRNSGSEKLNIKVGQSSFDTKNNLVKVRMNKSLATLTTSKSAKVLTKAVGKNSLELSKSEAAKLLREDIIRNVTKIVSSIGFQSASKIKYEISNVSLVCPALQGRITTCKSSYEVRAIVTNEKKKGFKALSSYLAKSKTKLQDMGPEIDIATYISELRFIDKKLSKLTDSEKRQQRLAKVFALKKDVQAEILDSYQYTAIGVESVNTFYNKLTKRVNN